ncbi:MAG: DNA-directed RNA polymerase subunit K [Thermoplasmata archaeon HGW-Thermoplasmata-2]|nr:MAG: DNA-directed RNA polymerase subunit K [Thermoplasmata archaeon HGW-Thermoplasmata-2]
MSGKSEKYTRFEIARIIGARALQIAQGAPVLIEVKEKGMDPVRIAQLEFAAGKVPIDVKKK